MPDVAQAKAPSQAPSILGTARGYLSFSSAETMTPESGAGGWPSRASEVGSSLDGAAWASFARGGWPSRTISPHSQPCLPDLDRQHSSGKNLSLSAADPADDASTSAGTASTSARRLIVPRAGELRRRKYAAPKDHQICTFATAAAAAHAQRRHVPLQGSIEATVANAAAPAARSAAGAESTPRGTRDVEDCEILIEGPLQQRALLFFWRWRWCVLDREELRVYVDENASLLMPERPIERHPVAKLAKLRAASDLHFPSMIVCKNIDSGEPLMYLRTGPGVRWEELASASLWLRAFTSAAHGAVVRLPGPPGSGASEAEAELAASAVGTAGQDAAPAL